MKNVLHAAAFMLVASAATAQQDTTTINSLKAPSSPVAVLLGFSPTDVMSISDRPKLEAELTNFVSKSKVSTILPKDFAFSLSPFKIAKSNNKYLNGLAISVGYHDTTIVNLNKTLPKSPQMAFGISWRIFGNNYKKTDKTQKLYATNYDSYMSRRFNASAANNKALRVTNGNDTFLLGIYSLSAEGQQADKEFRKSKNTYQFFSGWALDASAGVVLNQSTNQKDQAGVWLTSSWSLKIDTTGMKKKTADSLSSENQQNVLVMVRYLKHGDKSLETLKDESNQSMDFGVKYTYHVRERSRFFVEAEGLGRVIDSRWNDLKWKADVNLGFELRKNLVLTASFGKDFGSRTINRQGNLFALLNVIGGLGQSR